MSTMASARVPSEIYDQGTRRLASIGSNTTELIVSAFAFVAETGELPVCRAASPTDRTVSDEELCELRTKLERSSLPLDLPDDWDWREELAHGKGADYEALA